MVRRSKGNLEPAFWGGTHMRRPAAVPLQPLVSPMDDRPSPLTSSATKTKTTDSPRVQALTVVAQLFCDLVEIRASHDAHFDVLQFPSIIFIMRR